MHKSDLKPFMALLDDVYALYGKALNDGAKGIFFRALIAHSFEAVRTALDAHVKDAARGPFPPKPADLIAQLEGDDGQLGADEAWALALNAQDEAATVVWTSETAQAFGIARPVLERGDEVGARMAFKAAYHRLMDAARREGRGTHWQVSLGWDAERRAQVLTQAASAGQLPVQIAAALLPRPEDKDKADNAAQGHANLQRLREQLAALPSSSERAAVAREAEHRLQREALEAKKREMLQQAAQYVAQRQMVA